MKKLIAILLIIILLLNILFYAMGKISLTTFWIIILIAYFGSIFYRKVPSNSK